MAQLLLLLSAASQSVVHAVQMQQSESSESPPPPNLAPCARWPSLHLRNARNCLQFSIQMLQQLLIHEYTQNIVVVSLNQSYRSYVYTVKYHYGLHKSIAYH